MWAFIKIVAIQVVVPIFVVLGLMCYASTSKAAESHSKTVFCMDMAIAGILGFEMKQERQKLQLFTEGDPYFRKVANEALRFGYNKAKSEKEAADGAFKLCAEHKIWKR